MDFFFLLPFYFNFHNCVHKDQESALYEGITTKLILFKQGAFLVLICFTEVVKKIIHQAFSVTDDKILSSEIN